MLSRLTPKSTRLSCNSRSPIEFFLSILLVTALGGCGTASDSESEVSSSSLAEVSSASSSEAPIVIETPEEPVEAEQPEQSETPDEELVAEPAEPEEQLCDLPDNLTWTSTGAIVTPKNGDASIKDPSIVYYNGKYHIFATVWNGAYRSMYTSFTDFDSIDSGSYQAFSPGGSSTVAPQVFYFSPQDKWYIFTQWPAKYTTSDNIEDASSWAAPTTLWPGNEDHGGALDYWVICDDSNCYIYFFKDDGKMYYASVGIDNFPNFNVNEVKEAEVEGAGGQSILFEAGNVYKLKGTDTYLLQVEGWGAAEGNRLYRSWTSTSLDGPWQAHSTSEANPFAGLNNVDFPDGRWSQQISHGEMIRDGYDEKMVLDACNMRFLYQGVDLSGYNGDYNARPYRLGLLTANE